MKRILQVFGEPLSSGGQEAFIMNMYRNIDRTKIQFDFFTPYYCDNIELKEEIEKLGGKIYIGNGDNDSKKKKKEYILKLKKFLKNHKYEIIHIHSGSTFALAFGAKYAKKNGAKKVIVHSHCTGINNLKYRIIKKVSNGMFKKYATDYCACSKSAAEWKYPKNIIKNKKYTVIRNGIELEKYRYNKNTREKYRNQMNIKDKFVLCNVGRLTEEKNQIFLIELFLKVKSKINNAELFIIGEGKEKEKIIKMINQYDLQDSIKLLGARSDVNNLLQAADMFIFPSLYEGLGIAAVEAQAAGLKTLCSENIPDEAIVTDLFYQIKLSDGIEKWIEVIVNNMKYERKDTTNEIKSKGYDAKTSAKILEKIYKGVNK